MDSENWGTVCLRIQCSVIVIVTKNRETHILKLIVTSLGCTFSLRFTRHLETLWLLQCTAVMEQCWKKKKKKVLKSSGCDMLRNHLVKSYWFWFWFFLCIVHLCVDFVSESLVNAANCSIQRKGGGNPFAHCTFLVFFLFVKCKMCNWRRKSHFSLLYPLHNCVGFSHKIPIKLY